MHNQQACEVKIVLVGSGGVGKSALTLQHMYNEFIEDYEPTKADSYRKKRVIDSEEVNVDILDTAGQEDYASIRDNYFRTGEGFLFVFAVNDRDSLHALEEFHDQVIRTKGTPHLLMLLVANKSDLTDCPHHDETLADANRFAQLHNIQMIMTSAKHGTNVDKIFEDITRMVRIQQKNSTQQTKVLPNRKRSRICNLL